MSFILGGRIMDPELREKLLVEIEKADERVKDALQKGLDALQAGKRATIYYTVEDRFRYGSPEAWVLRSAVAKRIYLVLEGIGVHLKLNKIDCVEWDEKAEAHFPTGEAVYTISVLPSHS